MMHHRQPVNFRWLWLHSRILLLLLCLTGASAQSAASIPQPAMPVSIIELPLRLSLEPLVNASEEMLPHQAGNWRTWGDWHGIKYQYRAWRGPLQVTVLGDVLTVRAHIRYWIRARKKLLGAVNLRGSCGIDEPPRQALIGMQVRLGWSPDWTIRPQFRILPTRFLDRCGMTIADIDVTPVIEKEFRRQMQSSLRAALREVAPGVRVIRHQAQRAWGILQEPVELGQDNWLLLRPVGVALSPIAGRGRYLGTHLAIALRPALVTGPETAGTPAPLPPLGRHYPRSAGLNLNLGVRLDFASLNQRLSDSLADKPLVLKGRKMGIKEFGLGGEGQEIRARMELTGEVAGKAVLEARVGYDAQNQRLEFQDLTFDYDAEDFAVALLEQVLHERIRQELESAANEALEQYLDQLKEHIGSLLTKIMPADVALDLSALRFRTIRIHIEQQGIRLDGTATGNARLMLR